MTAPVKFIFDFISPYAHLAYPEALRLCERHDRTLEPVPVVFGAILDHHGHLGPAEIPPKRLYTFKNILRLAHARGRVVTPPPAHPFNPLLSLRAALAVEDLEARVRLVGRLFTAVWGPGEPGVTDPGVVGRLATEVGLDGAAIVSRATSPEIKGRLRECTEHAIQRGVFGVPTLLIDDELFWGLDAMPHAAAFLAGNDPLDHEVLASWASLPAGIQRDRARRADRSTSG